MKKKLIIWGGTGQAIVLREFLGNEYEIPVVFDNNKSVPSPFKDVKIQYGAEAFKKWIKSKDISQGLYYYIVAIGGELGLDRFRVHNYLKSYGLMPIKAVHPTSNVLNDVTLGDGCQVLANSTICARTIIGECSIINTSASIDHECIIGKGVHIGPGVNMAGLVNIGNYSFIGTGATVLPRLKIGSNSIVGAGSVVTKDIPDNIIVRGNPARFMRDNNPR